MKKYDFTIITVVKNDQKNIEKTLKSISKLKFKNFEYIIIDGKSKDKTVKLIKKYKKIVNVFISETDNGIYDAMNKGIKKAKGKIIVFCNSGDIFFPNALEIVKNKFKPQIDFVFGTVVRHYTKGTIIKHGFNEQRIYYNFDFATSHSTGFFLKKKIYDKLGYYDDNFKCSADYDFYFRMILSNKFHGAYTNKKEKIGEVSSGGFSSSLNLIQHLNEEKNIRLKNKQNRLVIILIYINSIVRNFRKILKEL